MSDVALTGKIVRILYENYRDEIAWRTILPEKMWWGRTEQHPTEQWLLDAFDIDRPGQYRRSFAMRSIFAWQFPE